MSCFAPPYLLPLTRFLLILSVLYPLSPTLYLMLLQMPLTLATSKAFGVVGVNLTSLFDSLAAQSKSRQTPMLDNIDSEGNDGKASLLASSAMYNAVHADSMNLALATAPMWVDYSDQVRADIEKAQERMTALDGLHAQRLMVSFGGEEVSQEEAIDAMSAQITSSLRSAENNIKRIALSGTQGGAEMTQSERELRLNVMRRLGSLLHETMSQFRKKQKDFLERLQSQQKTGSDVFESLSSAVGDSEHATTLETMMEEGLTEEEELQLRELEDRADQREKEIIHLVQAINDLASLFQELNSLVIEQGTILDRIDYTIETSLEKVVEGTAHLREADDHSRKTITLKLILIMIVIVIVEILILIFKHV